MEQMLTQNTKQDVIKETYRKHESRTPKPQQVNLQITEN